MGLGGADRRRVIVVGDDPALEMQMAHAGGLIGIGMTTGLMKRDRVDALSPAQRPDGLLDTLEPLLRAVG